MKISGIKVINYKGLRDTHSPISSFVCVVGENNAGKSSLLQCLLLFIRGTKLSKNEFYDPEADILITVELCEITEEVLSKLGEEHRRKIEKFVDDGRIKLARRYSTDGTSKLRIVTHAPKELNFRKEKINEALKGKKGKELKDTIRTFYPEIAGKVDEINTQKRAKELLDEFIETLPPEQLEEVDIPLETGIDNSIRALLPEPIYIPAVKDLADDLKTKESASFGKLLNILLDVIEDDLTEAKETFENLRKKLNRVTQDDGTILDERMDRVVAIEKTIQDNLQETFQNVTVELEIPPPEIKTVLSNANLIADDGVRGPIDHKGDGFKRAIAFTILRSYVQLSQDATWKREEEAKKNTKDKFLFLFEEPELYLHPKAQNILFEALSIISKRHQVVVTTHSPLFFAADQTKTFIKIKKKDKREGVPKPYGECLYIDLNQLSEKDKFQLISFETSNHAFFSSNIVLVEGDSELIVFPHVAKLLNQHWDFKGKSTSLVKINGKGSFQRYRNFFKLFETNVHLISDLDVIIRGFNKLEPSEKAKKLREELLSIVDKIIDEENLKPEPSNRLLKEELQREYRKKIFNSIREARKKGDVEAQIQALEEFFKFEKTEPRIEILKDSSRSDVLEKKRALLNELRNNNIQILEKGTIEDYYPPDVTGKDKPTKAQSFCNKVSNREQVVGLCELIHTESGDHPELEIIFDCIFNG
ncbi:MAG: AAA family ATPase [Deltaproteobacteria bacterium]|nr:AAA family ATPase [Deltaproteobacteria bacterium]